jgi:hypothetical protein
MVDADRLDKIERELERMSPATGPHEPLDDPTPEELEKWYEKALENPAVDYWDAYFRMIEEVEKLKDAGVIPTVEPRAGVTDIEAEHAEPEPESDTPAAEESAADAVDAPTDDAEK